jgi:hypothetical protein
LKWRTHSQWSHKPSRVVFKDNDAVLKKEGELMATERLRMNGQNIEVADKCNYGGAMLESTLGWNKQKTLASCSSY